MFIGESRFQSVGEELTQNDDIFRLFTALASHAAELHGSQYVKPVALKVV
jgi:hypothetical protein